MAAQIRFRPVAVLHITGHNISMADRSKYDGMTTNERLFEAGLLGAFGAAATARDRAEMIRLLAAVDVAEPAWSADTILQNPERYGY